MIEHEPFLVEYPSARIEYLHKLVQHETGDINPTGKPIPAQKAGENMIERAELVKQLIGDIDYVAKMFQGENAELARDQLQEFRDLLGSGE